MIQSWQQVADGFGQRLQGLSAEQWEAQTPCADWNVRQLVAHAVETQQQLGGQLGCPADLDWEGDAAGAWATYSAAMLQAISAEGALDQEVQSFMGPAPLAQAMGIPMNDLLVHTWDIARATGQSEELPEEIAGHALESLRPMGEMLRSPGFFGAEVQAGEDASMTQQLVAFLGRQP